MANIRLQGFKQALINKGLGPAYHVSNLFLSLLWLNLPDYEGKWIPHAITQNMYVSQFVMNIIEIVNNGFKKTKIV
jgi:hypothetical protein